MPKKYGIKEKDQVVAHIVNLVLTGRLRSGDRVDRNEIADELGLSRVPIQEAVVQLEHDGILSTRYHRGAFVEPFDDAAIVEHHEIYGLLSGIASARAAVHPTPRIVSQLESLRSLLRATKDSKAFNEAAWEYRRIIVEEYSGPRLRAMIESSQSFIPRPFWVTYQNSQDDLLPFYEQETEAIRCGDPEGAKAANVGRAEIKARIMLAELARRGVLGDLRSD